MPTYTFHNKETDEVWDELCSFSEKTAFLEANPHIRSIITSAPKLVASRYTSGLKNDEGWNENLARIAEAHPNSALAERHGSKSIKESKNREIIKKWRAQTGSS